MGLLFQEFHDMEDICMILPKRVMKLNFQSNLHVSYVNYKDIFLYHAIDVAEFCI